MVGVDKELACQDTVLGQKRSKSRIERRVWDREEERKNAMGGIGRRLNKVNERSRGTARVTALPRDSHFRSGTQC